MAEGVLNTPPPPADTSEQQRVNHTRLRRRLLYSQHETDLDDLIRRQLGNVRSTAWGKPDLTANPYLSLWSQVSVLYNIEPEVLAPNGSEDLAALVADAGYWPMMQRVQRDTLALREMFVRVDIDDVKGSPTFGQLSFRPVFPDCVEAEANPRKPHVPVRIQEWMPHPECGWVRHDLNIRGEPFYRVYDRDGANVTVAVLGATYDGDAYPYRDSEDNPILPYATYHAAQTGCLFDPYTLREIVEGSLNLGVLLTYYGHIVRNAAWRQRYGIGVEPAGAEVVENGDPGTARRELVTDPATMLLLRPMDQAANASVGTFENPADPESILRSIGMYERRIQLLANVQPPDVTRQEADVRSGYSLAVARESIREQQAIYEPQFRQGDQGMFRIAAALVNRVKSTSYSDTARDYRVIYKGLPKSPIEEKLEAEMLKVEVDAKRLGPVSAYMRRYPGVTYEEAVERLAKAAVESETVAAAVVELRAALGFGGPPPRDPAAPPPIPPLAPQTDPTADSQAA